MSETPHILIVEDEPKLADILSDYLTTAHFRVSILHEGTNVTSFVRSETPDLVLLDLMLPDKDGLTICRELRTFSQIPIIMITARVEEIDRLLGLELGADDYICKPFSPREVVARVKAILRRSYPSSEMHSAAHSPADLAHAQETAAVACGLTIDENGYKASYKGHNLELTPAEFRLLLLFTRNPGRVFSREQILDALYDDNRIVTDRTIDTHVKNLRRKMQQAQAPEECIVSVYGVGYRFDA